MSNESYHEQRERKARERAAIQEGLSRVSYEPTAWVDSQRIDDRRHKSYRLIVHVGVHMYIRDHQSLQLLDRRVGEQQGIYGEDTTTTFGYINRAVKEAFTGAPWPCESIRIDSTGSNRCYGEKQKEGWDYEVSFFVAASFEASRPKEILSEAEALVRLGGADNIAKHICAAIAAGIAKATEIGKAAERARIANLILDGYVEQIDEAAKVATRYKQRLAALNAEFQAEIEHQTTKLLADLGDKCGITWEDAPGFEPDKRSVAAAKAKLPKRIARLQAPSKRSSFPFGEGSHQDIGIKDVE